MTRRANFEHAPLTIPRKSMKLRKFFSFQGRIGRLEWAATVIGSFVGDAALTFVSLTASAAYESLQLSPGPVPPFELLYVPVFLWLTACAGVKRLHDRAISGKWLVAEFVGTMVLLYPLFIHANSTGLPTMWPAPYFSTQTLGVAMILGVVLVLAMKAWFLTRVLLRKGDVGTNWFGDERSGSVK